MRFAGFWKKRKPLSVDNLRSILIIKLSAIGDVVHTLPLLEVLRRNLPKARIDWLVEEEAFPIIEGHPALDRIIVSRRKFWLRNFMGNGQRSSTIQEILAFLRELRSEKYDLVLDIQGLLKSGLLTGFARARRKIGFTWAREGSTIFLSERPYFEDQHGQHAVERYLKTAKILGFQAGPWHGRIPLRRSDEEAVEKLLPKERVHGRYAAINPMARWDTKLWEPEKFARLADRIHDELSMTILFTGSRQDFPAIDEICRRMKNRGTINLAGKLDLKQLASLYARCDILISTDTGPMHIAAAMECPVVALFGPTAPWRTGPYGSEHQVVREDLNCSPCFKRKCSHRTCMKEITVGKVFQVLRDQFDGTATGSRPEKGFSAFRHFH